jgi:acid phosphatase family membrane protein YuiD
MIYIILVAFTWVLNGLIKFSINLYKTKNILDAKKLIGYGGFPSTHTAITSSIVIYIGLRYGFDSPSFGVGVALLWVTINDALSLRNKIGQHAKILNTLSTIKCRERVGHNIYEVCGGLVIGYISAALAIVIKRWV